MPEKGRDFDIDRVAQMAQLRLTACEKEAMEKDLREMLEFAGTLADIDTRGIEPAAHVLPLENVWRDDVAVPAAGREWLLQGAPSAEDGYILVPRVVE